MHENTAMEELLFENELLRDVIDKIHEGVLVVDDNEVIRLFNTGMEQIEGLNRSEMVGRDEQDAYSFLQGKSYNELVTQQIKKNKKPLLGQVYKYNLPDGRITTFIFNAYPFYYKNKLKAIYSIGRNMKQIEGFIAQTIEIYNQINRDKKKNRAYYFLDDIIGESRLIKEPLRLARKVAVRSSPVLIYGKTGTGKELFAQGIHNASMLSDGPFVPINCAAIPDTLLEATLFGTTKGAFTGAMDTQGLFEQAKDGTIFLDEINSMPKPLQAKLLRVLQEKVVRRLGGKQDIAINCRILSACNEDPFEGVSIRKDLLYRIAAVLICLPALSEHKEDIDELVSLFIRKFNLKFGFFVKEISPALSKAFKEYSWPGNVRELENVLETAMNMVDAHTQRLEVYHIPLYIQVRMSLEHNTLEHQDDGHFPDVDGGGLKLRERLWNFEKKIVEETLLKCNGNVTRAAEILGIQRQNLHYRIRRFGLRSITSDQGNE